MNRPWIKFAGLVMVLIIASCSGPAQPPPANRGTSQPHRLPTTTTTTTTKPPSIKPLPGKERGVVSAISLDDFFALQQSGMALIYDARAPFFYRLGHIPGAINLSRKQCDAAITARKSEIKAALAAGKTIIVYCTSITCPDAHAVAIHLADRGYPARIFPGGWEEWRSADLTN
jgi:3-mercaptopyruvate sulfurtransferase SseA